MKIEKKTVVRKDGTTAELTRLLPEDGYMLTQAGDDGTEPRTFAMEVIFGSGRSPQEWTEVTAEEAAAIEARQQAEAEQQQ